MELDNHSLESLIAKAVKDALTDPGLAGLIRPKDFPEKWGMSKSSVYRRMKLDPSFPKPVEIDDGGGIAFWVTEVAEYFRNKPRIDRYQGVA